MPAANYLPDVLETAEPERQAVKRDQEGIEIDITHAERSGDVERCQGPGARRVHAGGAIRGF